MSVFITQPSLCDSCVRVVWTLCWLSPHPSHLCVFFIYLFFYSLSHSVWRGHLLWCVKGENVWDHLVTHTQSCWHILGSDRCICGYWVWWSYGWVVKMCVCVCVNDRMQQFVRCCLPTINCLPSTTVFARIYLHELYRKWLFCVCVCRCVCDSLMHILLSVVSLLMDSQIILFSSALGVYSVMNNNLHKTSPLVKHAPFVFRHQKQHEWSFRLQWNSLKFMQRVWPSG